MTRIAIVLLGGTILFAAGLLESGRSVAPAELAAPLEAVAAVRDSFTLLHHFQASGGDSRFAERLPLAPALVAEVRGAAEWERHLDELTSMDPVRVEIVSAKVDAAGVATIRTREYTVAHTHRRSAPASAPETTRAIVGRWEYRVVRSGTGWRIADWTPIEAQDRRE